ncbi:MAG: DUF1552 domain-containing protein [Verrucomicrobiales bacterium]
MLAGLDHDKAEANGDGGGDHARANATFLTGCQAKKTAGADIRAGKSVDQIAADIYGTQTKLSSLELSCDAARGSGSCDSGWLRLPVQPVVADGKHADGSGGQPAPRLRAPVRRRRPQRIRRSPHPPAPLRKEHPRLRPRRRQVAATPPRRDRPAQDGRIPQLGPRGRAPGRKRGEVRQIDARRQDPGGDSRHLPRAYPAHVRPDGARLPNRYHPDFDLPHGARRQQPVVPRFRRPLRAPRNLTPPEQRGKAGRHRQIDRFYSEEWAYFCKLDSAKDRTASRCSTTR